MFRVHADANRYEAQADGTYIARDSEAERLLIEINVSGTFGDAYLA
jgi:hypothetical protein